MKFKLSLKESVIYFLLLLLVLFNVYLYRAEFKAQIDPNDNIFHAALVADAHSIWENVFKEKLSPFYLIDSWNNSWAEGFSLSTFYAHLPQAVISLFSFILPLSAYKIFVILRTLTLILLPVSFFLAGTVLRLPSAACLIFAFFSQAIFTDGLYGIDASSFIWRGWGLSAQLFALFFAPLAFAYTVDYLENKRNLGKAVLFNFIVGQCHFGLLFILLLGYPFYWLFSGPRRLVQNRNLRALFNNYLSIFPSLKRTLILISLIFISLSYFILPFFWLGKYRNFSYWDPIWKFNSWGIKQILIWLTNGNLFDFNRLPVITGLLFAGLTVGFLSKHKVINFLTALFGMYLVLFFGRATFGPIIDIIPGFSEYHLHRLIIGVQFTGIFISGWALYLILKDLWKWQGIVVEKLIKKDQRSTYSLVILIIGLIGSLFVFFQMEKPVIKYAKDNRLMIESSNLKYEKDIISYRKIVSTLRKLPQARVYAGRVGNWGKEFKIGDTQVYMALSGDGFPMIGFLPQSWSPNSDTEQFFDENNLDYYQLYQVRYLVLPKDKEAPKFASLIENQGPYSLYQVTTEGWFSFGRTDMVISGDKTDLLNITRLWFGSQAYKDKNYPQILLKKGASIQGITSIQMSDLNHFYFNNQRESVWQKSPFVGKITAKLPEYKKISENILANGYQTKITLFDSCPDCIMILKQSYFPGWQVIVNGKKTKTFPVFPFFIGISIKDKGVYEITAVYKPSSIKILLIILTLIIAGILIKKRKIWKLSD